VGGIIGNHRRLQAESRVSLFVVCNRWPGAVIGHIRHCCPKGLNSGDGFNGLMGGQSLGRFGCSLSDLVYRIFKSALNGFGKYRIELVDAAQHMSHHHSDGQHICRESPAITFKVLRQCPQSIMGCPSVMRTIAGC